MALSIINARHDAVECLIRSENISSADNMHGHLKGLKNIPRILRQLKCGKAGLHDWQGLVKVSSTIVLSLARLNRVTVHLPCGSAQRISWRIELCSGC